MKIILAILLILFLSTPSYAESDGSSLVIRGLDAYAKEGSLSAIKTWIKGSALEGSKEALSQANTLNQVQDYYGDFEDFEIIKINKISKRTQMVLYVINFNRGVLFGRFQAYKTKAGDWVATTFHFKTESQHVFPDSIVYGKE